MFFLLRWAKTSLKSQHIMKITFQLFALAVLSFAFSSCCGLLPCPGGLTAEKEVTTFKNSSATYYTAKSSYTVHQSIPETHMVTVKKSCTKCGSSFCPKPQCCGIVSDTVLARATSQGGTGEPQLGLIPTMKVLAE